MVKLRSLTSELLRQLFFVAAIPILVTSFFFLWKLFPTIEDNTTRQQQALTESTAAQTIQYLNNSAEQVHFFLDIEYADKQTESQSISRFLELSQYFEALYKVNSYNVVTNIGIKGKKHENISALYQGADMTRSVLFKNMHLSSIPHWSSVFLSIVTQRLSIAYIVPLGQETWIAEIALEELPQLSSQFSENNHLVMILDSDAQLIAHPDMQLAQQQINLNTLPFFDRFKRLTNLATEFTWRGEDYFGTIKQIPTLNWYIIVAQSQDQFSEPLLTLLASWFFATGFIVIVAFTSAYRRSIAFTKRFETMNSLARKIAKGDYTETATESFIHEFNELAHSLTAMSKDIRERESSIQTKELQLRRTLESTPKIAVQWYDAKGIIRFWNNASNKLFGFTSEEAIGKRLNHLIFNPQTAAQFNILLKRLKMGEVSSHDFEYPFHNSQENEGFISGTLFTIPGQGDEQLYVCMCIDITRQREAEADIRALNQELEQIVKNRTAALQDSNEQLQENINRLNSAVSQWYRSDRRSTMASLITNMISELIPPLTKSYEASAAIKDRSEDLIDRMGFCALTEEDMHEFIRQVNQYGSLSKYNLDHTQRLIQVVSQVGLAENSSNLKELSLSELVNRTIHCLEEDMSLFDAKVIISVPNTIRLNTSAELLDQILQSVIHDTFWQSHIAGTSTVIRITANTDGKHANLIINRESKTNIVRSDKTLGVVSSPDAVPLKPSLSLLVVNLLVDDILGGSINIEQAAITITLPLEHNTPPTEAKIKSV